jgi:small subunit ribosomal protein S6e
MVEFKAVIADTKTGKTYNTIVAGHHANSLVGKEIGDEFDGIFVALPGYKLKITGGSDKSGFPMRRDINSGKRQKVLLSKSLGFNPKHDGKRKKKNLCGKVVSPNIYQINMKIVSHGSKPIEELIKSQSEEEKK